jgi:hypothetical protein
VKVVTVRDFRDRATDMLRSQDLLLVTRDGIPAGFFVPWADPDIPDEVRRAVFLRLAERVRADRKTKGVTEKEVLRDFAASRRARR